MLTVALRALSFRSTGQLLADTTKLLQRSFKVLNNFRSQDIMGDPPSTIVFFNQ